MKKMKKFGCVAMILMLLVCSISTFTGCNRADVTLVVYNWADYMDLSLEEEFEQYYADTYGQTLNIVYSTFDTNETMMTKLLNGDANVDLICPSEYAIEKLMKADLLAKLDLNNIPNITNLNPAINSKVEQTFGSIDVKGSSESMIDYYAPYMMGTLGILYNTEYVTEADLATGWGLLWNEAKNPNLTGKILMKDSIRDAYVAGVMYAKQKNILPEKYKDYTQQQLINTVDDELLAVVEEILKEQKSELKGYEVDLGKDDMIKGTAYINFAWSGDALYAIEEAEAAGIELAYYVPNDEGNIWFDGWVIPKASQNKLVAERFINYLLRPEISMRNAMEIGYTSCTDASVLKASEEAISILQENEYDVEEFFNDLGRYPEIDTESDVLGVMKDFGDKNDAVVSMWERVKASGDNGNKTIFIIIGVIAGVVVIGAVVAFIINKGNSKKRKKVVKKAN